MDDKGRFWFNRMLWVVAILLILFVGYMMFTIGFPTMPTYGRMISSLTFVIVLGFAVWKLYNAIKKRNPYI